MVKKEKFVRKVEIGEMKEICEGEVVKGMGRVEREKGYEEESGKEKKM